MSEPNSEIPPKWAVEMRTSLERRFSSLEQAVIAGAAKAGAVAGRRWSTIISGAAMMIVFSALLSQCDPPVDPPVRCEAGVCETGGTKR